MSAAQRQQTKQNPTASDAEAVEPRQAEQMDSAPAESAPAEPAPVEPAAAPLTSLDALFGGALEGASTCAVDGTCD